MNEMSEIRDIGMEISMSNSFELNIFGQILPLNPMFPSAYWPDGDGVMNTFKQSGARHSCI